MGRGSTFDCRFKFDCLLHGELEDSDRATPRTIRKTSILYSYLTKDALALQWPEFGGQLTLNRIVYGN